MYGMESQLYNLKTPLFHTLLCAVVSNTAQHTQTKYEENNHKIMNWLKLQVIKIVTCCKILISEMKKLM